MRAEVTSISVGLAVAQATAWAIDSEMVRGILWRIINYKRRGVFRRVCAQTYSARVRRPTTAERSEKKLQRHFHRRAGIDTPLAVFF